MTKSIKPLFDNVLILPLETESKSPSGIIIPDSVKEKPQEGKIIAVGPGKPDENGKLIKITVKVGDKVMYKEWGGTKIKIEGKEHLLIKEEDLLAVLG